MSKIKAAKDAGQAILDMIPGQKEMNAVVDFSDDMVNAGKKVVDDLGQGAKNAVIKTADFLETNPVAKTIGAPGKFIQEIATPNMIKNFSEVRKSGLDNPAAFSKVWGDSSLLDKAEMVLMFTPAKGISTALNGAKNILKAGGQLSTKQLAIAEKALSRSLDKVQRGLFKQADELAKAAPAADDVVKQSDELVESGLDFSQGKDKLDNLGFNPNANMSKAADDVVKTSEVTPQKMDVAKLKEQGKASTEQVKELETATSEIKNPEIKTKIEEAMKKNPNALIEWLKNSPRAEKWTKAEPSLKRFLIGLGVATPVALGVGAGLSVASDTNNTIKNINNGQSKEDPSKLMSKAPDSTTSNEAQDKVSLTLETRKLPNGLLPHQVISKEMGLNWNKSRDEIDDGLKSMGIDLSTTGKPGSAERNIAMANYVVQLKTKHPEKFKKLQESIASNINP